MPPHVQMIMNHISPLPDPDDAAPSLAAQMYDTLRMRLITGQFVPGHAFSTRTLASELGVSQMPVRDALSRLAAEGAVEIRSKRRITVPAMTRVRYDDLMRCRMLLEPATAVAALPHIDVGLLDALREIDRGIDTALASGAVNDYMVGNFRFHFLLYRAGPAPTSIRMIEMLWAQFGPFMRAIYGRCDTSALIDRHQEAIHAIASRDAQALHHAISEDIADGMRLIQADGLDDALC